jgi:hypothetical protein
MALGKLGLLPDSSSYSVKEGNDAISATLDGGLPRQRLDVLGATKTIECQWILDRAEYVYIRAFYNAITFLSGVAFLIDLIIDDSDIEEHTVLFTPGSLKLSKQEGLAYTVTASLEARPIIRTEGYNDIIVVLFDAYGSDYDTDFNIVAALTETLMNVTLPAI